MIVAAYKSPAIGTEQRCAFLLIHFLLLIQEFFLFMHAKTE
jgi:hypothetical protein